LRKRDGPTPCLPAQRIRRVGTAGVVGYLALIGGTALASTAAVSTAAVSRTNDVMDYTERNIVWLQTRAAASTFVPDADVFLLSLLNEYRAVYGAGALTMHAGLRDAARQHSRSMALHGFLSGHGTPLGRSLLERMSPLVPPGTVVAENVTLVQNAAQGHTAFLASSEHVRNMLAPGFHDVGIGVATAGAYRLAVTEIFAR
jgi:uncharacterized protein YkwD